MVPATLAMPAAKASPSILSILALDLGSTTGWALRNDRCRILHGTAAFRPTRFEGGGMRYLRFERWLDETRKIAGGIDAVYFEEVRRHAGTDAAHVYGGFLARSDRLVRGPEALPTRASRSAPSSVSPPARAMPTSRR